MPKLNLPILDQLAQSRSILIAGIGGGFDLFCGLPLYFHLRQRGYHVHLANYSFADVQSFGGGIRLSETLVGVKADYDQPVVYFPELHLARWFQATRQEDCTIWAFHKTGVRPLRENYQRLLEQLQIDTILLIDGGVDSLARGNEAEPGTFIEDSVSMAALVDVPSSITRLLVCVGFGAEREVTHAHMLENMADLAQRGAFLGACALTRAMPEYQAYEDAVLMAHGQPFQDPSVINASVISAVRGAYGDYHLTEKTHGSRLWISPLMSLYWFYDFPTVAAQHLVLPAIKETTSFQEAIRAALTARRTFTLRRPDVIPL
ncbi:MAG: DUF1152 domain-containing protein [Chloroflexaceae bacterium]|jgi:hypothetical protein|nr:DUF1152 domain-containing protein [Chloroflexaceae bacterium]